jgi:ABC-type polysaccharide/polyol phosphate transport system ATPase subunit
VNAGLQARLPPGGITLEGVGKRYTKYEDTPTLAYGLLHSWGRSRRSQLWALRETDLAVQPGESVGVIGKNGSGKSTLLQMLCGVTRPTTGQVRVGGRIAPLISVGVGFHPELTGRENVFVNGTILGLTRAQVAARLDAIVAFSEIESFIDTPVKFYSSGMFVRLGFSVAAHVEPDVLLIDEVLAVGDLGFQLKCYRHMEKLRGDGTTIIIVSHNMPALEQYCQRGVVLERGHKVFDGPISDAVNSYYATFDAEAVGERAIGEGTIPFQPGVLNVSSASLVDQAGIPTTRFEAGETAILRVQVEAWKPINSPFMWVDLISEAGVSVYSEHNLFSPYPQLDAGTPTAYLIRIPLHLTSGSYFLRYSVGRGNQRSREFLELADDMAALTMPGTVVLYVKGRNTAQGVADLNATFDSEPGDRITDSIDEPSGLTRSEPSGTASAVES